MCCGGMLYDPSDGHGLVYVNEYKSDMNVYVFMLLYTDIPKENVLKPSNVT